MLNEIQKYRVLCLDAIRDAIHANNYGAARLGVTGTLGSIITSDKMRSFTLFNTEGFVGQGWKMEAMLDNNLIKMPTIEIENVAVRSLAARAMFKLAPAFTDTMRFADKTPELMCTRDQWATTTVRLSSLLYYVMCEDMRIDPVANHISAGTHQRCFYDWQILNNIPVGAIDNRKDRVDYLQAPFALLRAYLVQEICNHTGIEQ